MLQIYVFLFKIYPSSKLLGFPGGSVIKNPPANAGDAGLIPGLGRSPEDGNANPLQYACLGDSADRGACQTPVCGIAKNQTQFSD